MDRQRDEGGAVTAEAAVVLPVMVLLALALGSLVALGVSQVRVVDAAREAARAIARGEDPAAAVDLGRKVAPAGAEFDVTTEDGRVHVFVTAEVQGPGGILDFLPGFRAHAEAVALLEAGP